MSSPARGEEDDSKAAAAAVAPLFITLKVVNQQQNRVRLTMKRTDKLQLLMDAWYREVPDVQYGTGTFWFEEICQGRGRTPAELKLEDGDLIDFYEYQDGGGLVA